MKQPRFLHAGRWSTIALAVFCWLALLCGLVPPCALAAAAQASRTLYVNANSIGGDGLNAGRPLATIAAALQKAREGDVIAVAPGEYREFLQVPGAGITIQGAFSDDNVPLVSIYAPAGKNGGILTDSFNTVWRGVAFRAEDRSAITLRGFTGRFEHCLFASESPVPMLEVYGGAPLFQACTFEGPAGPSALMALNGVAGRKSSVTMAYCLFRNITGSAVLLRGEQDVRFVNCLFAACRFAAMRQEGVGARVSATNCIFFLSPEPKLLVLPGFPWVTPVRNWPGRGLDRHRRSRWLS